MREFLIRLGTFALVSVVIFFLTYQLNRYLFRTNPVKLSSDTTMLMTGSSRVESALNPELIPGSANTAVPQFPMVVHYKIIKHILENNDQLKTVVLGFSPSNFSGALDEMFHIDEGVKNMFDFIYPIIDRDDLGLYEIGLRRYIKSSLKNRVVPNPIYIKNAFSPANKKRFPFMGRFRKRKASRPEEKFAVERIARHFYYADTLLHASRIDVNYVDSIALLASEMNVKLVLIKLPVHERYLKKVPSRFTTSYEQFLKNLLAKHENITSLDLQNLPLKDEHFLDTDHTNLKGAEIVSKELEKLLSEPL